MLRTLSERQHHSVSKVLHPSIRPIEVARSEGQFPLITFESGSTGVGSCVRCVSPPCMTYSTGADFLPDGLSEFSYDRDASVCPTKAIRWPTDAVAPEVSLEDCIGCGLCVARCPVFAIALRDEGAVINDATDNHWHEVHAPVTDESARAQWAKFGGVHVTGVLREEVYKALRSLREQLTIAIQTKGPQFPNLLARNLFRGVGLDAAMSRRGDTNSRIDVVLGLSDGRLAAVGVEMGGAVMDAPRDMLDDIAILVARYGLQKDRIVPVVVTDALPNARAEYWQVMSDIEDVLDLKVRSVTIGALVVLVWANAKLSFADATAFFLNASVRSLRPEVEKQLGAGARISESGYPGCFESAK